MNQFKELHHNDYGTAIYCKCNEHIHLAFGNIALAQSRAEFDTFSNEVRRLYTENSNACPYHKNLAIRTPIHKIVLLFNLVELQQLLELLENSKVLLEIEDIFSDKD